MALTQKLGWTFVVLAAIAFPALGIEFQLETCNTPDFGTKYNSLVDNEPAIAAAYDKIVRLTGNLHVSGCHFEVPIKNGIPTDGLRRLVLDQHWQTTQIIDGLQKQTYHQHGLKVEYLVKTVNPSGPGAVVGGPAFLEPISVREVVSFQVCRTPESCQGLGIQP